MSGASPGRRRVARAVLWSIPLVVPRWARAASDEPLRLYLPFPLIGATEYIGALPASRAQRGLQAAAPAGPTDALARILARAAEVATGRPVRVIRLPGGRGERACRAVAGDPRAALLASEALCVHDAVASPRLRSAVDRLEIGLAVARVPYRRVGAGAGQVEPPCTIAHAGHGGRAAGIAARLAAAGAECREVACNGGEAALRAVLGGQCGQAVLPWSLAREPLARGQLRDMKTVGPSGWFALLSAPGSAWAGSAGAVAGALAGLASEPTLDRLGLLAPEVTAAGLGAVMLQERISMRLSSLRAATCPGGMCA